MGIKREANGVWKVGGGVTDGNDYKGVADKKSLLIQLTADGATQESMDNLEYLKAYADYNYTLGQPIFPHDISVWLSNNGKTAAIEADDISLEDGVYTIGGITCEDGTWDFSNAGQSGGGGGGSSDLPEVDSDDNGKVLTVVEGEWSAAAPAGGAIITLYLTGTAPALDDLPPVTDPTKEWVLFGSGPYLSNEADGTALTFTELYTILDDFKNGDIVRIKSVTDQQQGPALIHSETFANVILIETADGSDGDNNLVAIGIKLMTLSEDAYGNYQATVTSGQ